MDTAPKIVLQNPYRILGVYANATKKDIVANKGKATAFLNVNKPVEYPLDLKGILPGPDRTLDLMNEAEGHLAIAKEQIKYAQFWFLQKMSPLDDIAFNHLLAGNMAGALEIWSKQESLSSLQNKLVCYLIESKLELAVKTAERLYEKFGNDYISKVDANCTLQMTATDLLHQFVDSLGEEIGMQTMLGFNLGADTKAYISSQTIGPLINKISSEVDKTKKVDHKDSKARIEAARKLVANTKEALSQLKSILPATDSQYQMIADKLGLEILQCGIDYFNNSKDEGRHKTAMKMQKYAQSIVVGSLAKQRCEENVRILQDLIDKLPPEEIAKEHEHLQQVIALFLLLPADVDDVLKFLKDTCADLVFIKTKLGKQHAFYQQEATLIAQIALSKSIDALNEVQENELPKLNGSNRSSAIETVIHAFAASWEAMLWIELIDTDAEFKRKRLQPNKIALKKILDQVDAFDVSALRGLAIIGGGSYSVFAGCAYSVKVDPYTYYTDDEMLGVCKTIATCKQYLDKFARGKHISEVKDILKRLEYEQEENKKYKSSKTEKDFEEYIALYPNGKYINEAKRRHVELKGVREKEECEQIEQKIERCKTVSDCVPILKLTNQSHTRGLIGKLDDKFYSLCKRRKDYRLYIEKIGDKARHYDEAKTNSEKADLTLWIEQNQKLTIGIVIVILIFILIGLIWGPIAYKILFGLLTIICIIGGFSEDGCIFWVFAIIFGSITSAINP